MLLSTLFSTTALLVAGAAAHGAVTSYVIGGTTYPGFACLSSLLKLEANMKVRYEGYSPASSPPTIERQWPSYDPILSITDSGMRCNGGTSAALNASLAAGTTVTAKWTQWSFASSRRKNLD